MMMIGITLSLGAILVAWTGQSYGAFGGGSQLYFQQRGQSIQESFVIEEVVFNKNLNSSAPQIFVFVRNVGYININIAAIYLNGQPTAPTQDTTGAHGWCYYSGTPASASILVGAVCDFAFSVSTWSSGQSYVIVVASQRGNQVAATWRAP